MIQCSIRRENTFLDSRQPVDFGSRFSFSQLWLSMTLIVAVWRDEKRSKNIKFELDKFVSVFIENTNTNIKR